MAGLEQGQVRTCHHPHGKGNVPIFIPIHGLLGGAADISFLVVALKGREVGIYCEVGAKVKERLSKRGASLGDGIRFCDTDCCHGLSQAQPDGY